MGTLMGIEALWYKFTISFLLYWFFQKTKTIQLVKQSGRAVMEMSWELFDNLPFQDLLSFRLEFVNKKGVCTYNNDWE